MIETFAQQEFEKQERIKNERIAKDPEEQKEIENDFQREEKLLNFIQDQRINKK